MGCANGLLLESLIGWARDAGFTLRPHGIDFVPELVALAQRRHPRHAARFAVANAFDWMPPRRYDYVRTNLEYVPAADRVAFVRRQLERLVAPNGRLVVCHYRNPGERKLDPAAVVEEAGHRVSGRTGAPGVAAVWVDRPGA